MSLVTTYSPLDTVSTPSTSPPKSLGSLYNLVTTVVTGIIDVVPGFVECNKKGTNSIVAKLYRSRL